MDIKNNIFLSKELITAILFIHDFPDKGLSIIFVRFKTVFKILTPKQ